MSGEEARSVEYADGLTGRRGLKRFLPRKLFARTLLIILVPVIIAQGLATWVFFSRHLETTTRRLASGVAGDIAIIVELLNRDSSPDGVPDTLAAAAQALVEKTKAVDPDPAKYVPIAIVRDLSDKIAAMSASLATDRATGVVAKAKADGKVSPAMEDWAKGYAEKDPDGFLAWASAAPVIVPPGGGTKGKPPAGDTGLSGEETAICSQLGISIDDYKKSRGAE